MISAIELAVNVLTHVELARYETKANRIAPGVVPRLRRPIRDYFVCLH